MLWEDSLDLEVLDGLAGTRSYPVFSTFKPTYNMAVNLLSTRDIADVRKTLERSFAQFQADRAAVADATELQRAQQSLLAYQEAIASSDGDAAARWRQREKSLRQRIRKISQRLKRQTGSIARQFELVVAVLNQLGYLQDSSEADTPRAHAVTPTALGLALTKIYGDRGLLAVSALKEGLWLHLKEAEFAALIATLTYEPRRGESDAGSYPLSAAWNTAVEHTLRLWAELESLESAHKISSAAMPCVYAGWVMHAWASKKSLETILAGSGLSIGDFLRWAKQTADLLGQIAQACEVLIEHEPEGYAVKSLDYLSVATLARRARGKIVYGIVESSII